MVPEVSVVIPFYDTKPEWLYGAIQSVLSQSFQDFELILVNDGSHLIYDFTSCLLAHQYVKVIMQPHRGVAVARNTGITNSKGKYVAFLDSDDEWMPIKLDVQVKQMRLHSECLLSHTSYFQVSDGKFNPVGSGWVGGHVYPWIGIRCPIATPTVMVERDILNKHRFPEGWQTGEDTFLWMQIAKESPILGLPICLAKVRGHTKPLKNKVESVMRNTIWMATHAF